MPSPTDCHACVLPAAACASRARRRRLDFIHDGLYDPALADWDAEHGCSLHNLQSPPLPSGYGGGSEEAVRVLLEFGADAALAAQACPAFTQARDAGVLSPDDEPANRSMIGATPLHLAALLVWDAALREQGNDVGLAAPQAKGGGAAAVAAAEAADAEPVTDAAAWERFGVTQHAESPTGASQARVVQLLVEHGADLDAATERSRETPLTLGALHGAPAAVLALIHAGARLDLGRGDGLRCARPRSGWLAAGWLAGRGSAPALLCAAASAAPSLCPARRPLDLALLRAHLSTAAALLLSGASVLAGCNSSGKRPSSAPPAPAPEPYSCPCCEKRHRGDAHAAAHWSPGQ